MTEKEKKLRIALIENDVNQIMRQLYDIEMRVDMDLQPKPRLMSLPTVSVPKTPSIFKKLWTGFLQEMKQ